MTTSHQLVLGIESSCDETAAAIVQDGLAVRSNVIASQHALHEEYGGVVPEIASRAHAEKILPVIRKAVADAGITLDDLDAIAVGNRPGLIGSLLVGVSAAKALAWSLGVPIVGVDHVHAHLYAGQLDATPAVFPALGLVVSGGHTSIYRCESMIDLTRLGSTIDDAMGEAFDKVAKMLALPYPGGPNVDRLAQEEGADDAAYAFPISRLKRDSLDFSFSGLKTAVLYAIRGVPKPGGVFERTIDDLSHEQRRDTAASFQRAAVEAIILKLTRAVKQTGEQAANRETGAYQTLLVGGGVSANTLLRRRLTAFAHEHGLALRLPALEHCVDNAAMIAGLGSALLQAGRRDDLTLTATPTTAC